MYAAARPGTPCKDAGAREEDYQRRVAALRWVDSEIRRLLRAIRREAPDDGRITFGELHTRVGAQFDAISGALVAARRRGAVAYEGGGLLLRGTHDGVVITLIREDIPDTRLPRREELSRPPRASLASRDVCGGCSKLVLSQDPQFRIEAGGIAFHPQCFVCTQCRCPLRDGEFCVVNRRAYCRPHYAQTFQARAGFDFDAERERAIYSGEGSAPGSPATRSPARSPLRASHRVSQSIKHALSPRPRQRQDDQQPAVREGYKTIRESRTGVLGSNRGDRTSLTRSGSMPPRVESPIIMQSPVIPKPPQSPSPTPPSSAPGTLPAVGREWELTDNIIGYIAAKGTYETDIFRNGLFPEELDAMWDEVRRGPKQLDPSDYSCSTAAMCLKRHLLTRDPVIPYAFYDTLMAISRMGMGYKGALLCIAEVVRKSPVENAVVLYKLLLLLEEIAGNKALTGSDSRALGYTFGPVLIRPRHLPDPRSLSPLEFMHFTTNVKFANEIVTCMIDNIQEVFDLVPAIADCLRGRYTSASSP
eukprot:m51a1_g14013 hypothetical protein (532) ;mRNA; r:1093110-1094839